MTKTTLYTSRKRKTACAVGQSRSSTDNATVSMRHTNAKPNIIAPCPRAYPNA